MLPLSRKGRQISVRARPLISTASAARQPKWVAMKAVSQPKVWATISTGGAA